MRIWSLDPTYLDAKGLVALWRETLLAKNVLLGNTKGYRKHPQLERFKKLGNPLQTIDKYLEQVFIEATARGYNFNQSKFESVPQYEKIPVTKGQLQYEFQHLLSKLELRDPKKHQSISQIEIIETHKIFTIIDGEIENWEKIDPGKSL